MQVTIAPAADNKIQLAEPAQILRGISVGQQVEAVVTQNAQAGQLVTLQLADRQIQIRAEIALTQGQTLVLERLSSSESAALKLLSLLPAPALEMPPVALKPGVQVPVEVMKILAQQNVLVKLLTPLPNMPSEVEVDISQLPVAQRNIRAGDNLVMEVLRLQPLSIALKTPPPVDVPALQRQLLPQVITPPAKLLGLMTPVTEPNLQRLVQPAMTQLLQAVPPVQVVQTPEGLQQAVRQSGVFLESQIAAQAPLVRDLKANLLTLAAALKTALQTPNVANLTSSQVNQLPEVVRQNLVAILSQPQGLQQLPGQVPSLLTSVGKTPTQLIMQLLAGQTTLSPLPQQSSLTQPAQTLPPVITPPNQAVPNQVAELARLQLLLREVESTLARVQLNQLSMLRDVDTNSPTVQTNQLWLTDLPVRDKQQLQWLQLQVERQGNNEKSHAEGDDHWQVTLNLDTLTLGKLQAAISLQSNSVQVILTADSKETVKLLEEDLDWLYDKLAALDLTVGQCRCRLGEVEWLTPVPNDEQNQALLDISV